MRFAITLDHCLSYRDQGFLELEGLISQKEIKLILQELPQGNNPEILFSEGIDLWRKIPSIKKLAMQKKMTAVLARLANCKHLRLAFDQLIPTTGKALKYFLYQETEATLESFSSIEGLECGVIYALKTTGNPSQEHLFPHQAGNGVVIAPSTPLRTAGIEEEGLYLLIVYASRYSRYVPNPHDPKAARFKHLGYIAGSPLSDAVNPSVFP